MARPSQNIDKKLIALGKEKMMKYGVSNISIRSMCLESGVNLGMFHYHFKSKENFIRIIFNTLSNDLKNYWISETAGIENSKDKLKKVILVNTKIVREQKGVFETIIKDINLFDDFYVNIAREMHKLWGEFFFELIDNCKKDGYLDKSIDNNKLASVLVSSVVHYAKHYSLFKNDPGSDEEYYIDINELIDILMEKFK